MRVDAAGGDGSGARSEIVGPRDVWSRVVLAVEVVGDDDNLRVGCWHSAGGSRGSRAAVGFAWRRARCLSWGGLPCVGGDRRRVVLSMEVSPEVVVGRRRRRAIDGDGGDVGHVDNVDLGVGDDGALLTLERYGQRTGSKGCSEDS